MIYRRDVRSSVPRGSVRVGTTCAGDVGSQALQSFVALGSFLSTFTRQEFLSGMGFAITHSKVLVIDPFGDHPVVARGSHNMSNSASTVNDENLLIIEDCPELARAYAVNCMSVYKNYRWPAYQHDVKHTAGSAAAKGYLGISDAWQKVALDNDLAADLAFWGVHGAK